MGGLDAHGLMVSGCWGAACGRVWVLLGAERYCAWVRGGRERGR